MGPPVVAADRLRLTDCGRRLKHKCLTPLHKGARIALYWLKVAGTFAGKVPATFL